MESDGYFIINKREDFEAGLRLNLDCVNDSLSLSNHSDYGCFITHSLDSLENSTIWRSVAIDAVLPAAARMTCTYYCANNENQLAAVQQILKDQTLGHSHKMERLKAFARGRVVDKMRFLLTDCVGRYVILALEVAAKQGADVSIRHIQVFCRQESISGYLPEIFREDFSFLDRYLRLMSHQYIQLENTIAQMGRLFNPATAPAQMLPWLAELLCINHVNLWSEEKLRIVLAEGVYRKKGTPAGLSRLIEIYTAHRPYVVETFRALAATSCHEVRRMYSGNDALIFLPQQAVDGAQMLQTLNLLVQDFVPANLLYNIIILKNAIILSRFTYLGINSHISNYSTAQLNQTEQIPYVILGG